MVQFHVTGKEITEDTEETLGLRQGWLIFILYSPDYVAVIRRTDVCSSNYKIIVYAIEVFSSSMQTACRLFDEK